MLRRDSRRALLSGLQHRPDRHAADTAGALRTLYRASETGESFGRPALRSARPAI